MPDPTQLQDWVPVRIEMRPTGPEVDWCYLGERTLREPFYEHTVRSQMRDPYYMTSRKRTGLGDLVEQAQARPGLPLSGIIFHMSRCGSTLVSRVLQADPAHVVVSEAPPIDEALAIGAGMPEDDRVTLLRATAAALGQPRAGGERRFFLKVDSWHIHELPLFRRAFPEAPWVFVYREPVEVIVSHQRLRGMQMVPGQIPPHRLGLDPAAAGPPYDLDRYCAQVIGRFCESAAGFLPAHGGLPVSYHDLPGALWSDVLPHFGLRPSAEERAALELELQFHAKYPGQSFQPDSESKRQSASPAQVALAEQYVRPAFARIERLRQSSPVTLG